MDMYAIFKAIGDPVRLDILKLLAEGPKSVGEIVGAFDLAQPTISHHLGILKNAGLVVTRKENRSVIYSLNSGCVADTCCCFMDDVGVDPSEGKGTK
jgi:DNA-binding transcriptional ArsR family regulator